jgi:hypothetical protein
MKKLFIMMKKLFIMMKKLLGLNLFFWLSIKEEEEEELMRALNIRVGYWYGH